MSIVFEFSYQPFSKEWLRGWYALLVTPLLVIRGLATAEAFWLHAKQFPYRWHLALTTGLLALLFALVVAWRFDAVGAVRSAVQIRRVVVIGIAAFLGIYTLLIWSLGRWRTGFASVHLLLLFLVCLVMSISIVLRMAYPFGIWHAVNPIAYGVTAFIYLGWAWLFSLSNQADRQL